MQTRNSFLIPAIILTVGCASILVGHAQPTSGVPRLRGIVSLPDKKWAVVENPLCRPFRPLGTGQRVFAEDSAAFSADGQLPTMAEIRHIELSVGGVTLRLDQTNQLRLRLEGVLRRPAQTMILQQVSLDALLSLYAEISGRTVLRHPLLPTNSFSVNAIAGNRSDALAVLDRTLGFQDIVTKLDGDKFVMVVPRTLAETAVPGSAQIQRHPPDSPKGKEALIPARYTFYELQMLAAQYASFKELQFDWQSPVPTGVGRLEIVTQSNLTQSEFGYALRTLLAWQGVKLIPFGKNQAKIVPIESE